MRLIIAGSRDFTDQKYLFEKIDEIRLQHKITVINCGLAKGADNMGKKYGQANDIEIIDYPALWDDLTAQPCKIKLNKYGKEYNVLAGFNRNEKMAVEGDILAVFYKKGASNNGSKDMKQRSINHGLIIYEYER